MRVCLTGQNVMTKIASIAAPEALTLICHLLILSVDTSRVYLMAPTARTTVGIVAMEHSITEGQLVVANVLQVERNVILVKHAICVATTRTGKMKILTNADVSKTDQVVSLERHALHVATEPMMITDTSVAEPVLKMEQNVNMEKIVIHVARGLTIGIRLGSIHVVTNLALRMDSHAFLSRLVAIVAVEVHITAMVLSAVANVWRLVRNVVCSLRAANAVTEDHTGIPQGPL